jgi:cyanophycin synthetase
MDVIRTRVDSFAANLNQSPGRFNVLDIKGATVVIDYGHNSSALLALIEAIEKFPHQRRTIVYSTAGDRRDCDIVRQGEIIGQQFDRVILFEDHYLRGRAEGEIIGLFRQGMANGSRVKEVAEIRGAVKAIEAGLASAQPGDLLLVQADTIDETVEFMETFLNVQAEPLVALPAEHAKKPVAVPMPSPAPART